MVAGECVWCFVLDFVLSDMVAFDLEGHQLMKEEKIGNVK